MKELSLLATIDNLPTVLAFLEEQLEEADCPLKTQMRLAVAAEEIFVNIASYAYAHEDNIGKAVIRVETLEDPLRVVLTFMDNGMPYDPLAKEDPDVTLSAEDRKIGGLGIFMTKKSMDNIQYEYKNGQNILTIEKNL